MREHVRVPDDTPTPADIKRRARAAWAYSLKEQKDLAGECGIAYNTLRGLLAATGPAPSVEQAWAIATACLVPRSFITEGFANRRSDDEQIQELLRQLAERLPQAGIDGNDLRTVIDESRRSAALHVAEADADLADQAASDTRDAEGATPADPAVHPEGTRRIADGGDG